MEPDRLIEVILALIALVGGQEGYRYMRRQRRVRENNGSPYRRVSPETRLEIEQDTLLKRDVEDLKERVSKLEEEE